MKRYRIVNQWDKFYIESKFLFIWTPHIEYNWEYDTRFWFWFNTVDEAEDYLKQLSHFKQEPKIVVQEYNFTK